MKKLFLIILLSFVFVPMGFSQSMTDEQEPDKGSKVYTSPVEIRESCTLKAKSDKNEKVFEKTFTAHKAMGRPAKILTETHPSYTFSCPDLLTDGIRGAGHYTSGDFAGWYIKPFEAVIDMDLQVSVLDCHIRRNKAH